MIDTCPIEIVNTVQVIQLSVINKDVYLSPTHTYLVLITVRIFRLIPLPEDF